MDAFASGSLSYGLAWARYDAEGRMVGRDPGFIIFDHLRIKIQKKTKIRHKSEQSLWFNNILIIQRKSKVRG